MGGVFSSKANTAAQQSGSKRPRDDAPAPKKLQSLRAEKRAERGAVLLTPWGQALTKAYGDLKANGETTSAVDLYDFGEFNKLVGFEDVWEFEKKFPEIA